MDHLLPLSESHFSIAVPYLGMKYDENADFYQFGQRWAISTDKLRSMFAENAESFLEATAFCQAWLFFGVLDHILRLGPVSWNMDDYVSLSKERWLIGQVPM